MRDLNTVEMRIVDRTLYLIGQKGTVDVPVRTIVKEAKVNLGAINYYFETKEQLLSLVREFYTDNMLKTVEFLENQTLDLEERLIYYANETMKYALLYPNSVVLVKDAYRSKVKSSASEELIRTLNHMFSLLDAALKEYLGEHELKIKKMIFMAAMIYPTEDNANDGLYISNIDTSEKRIYYIHCLLKMLKNSTC